MLSKESVVLRWAYMCTFRGALVGDLERKEWLVPWC